MYLETKKKKRKEKKTQNGHHDWYHHFAHTSGYNAGRTVGTLPYPLQSGLMLAGWNAMHRARKMTCNTDGVSSVQLCFWATATAVELTADSTCACS
jgi:hypothetical protein